MRIDFDGIGVLMGVESRIANQPKVQRLQANELLGELSNWRELQLGSGWVEVSGG